MHPGKEAPIAGPIASPAQPAVPVQAEQLRTAAEAALARVVSKSVLVRTTDELLHELQVHQIELEMQNETLRQTQLALKESLDRYIDLYEFAPVVYLTLTDSGRIAEINLTGVTLFGESRSALLNRGFVSFVVAEEQDEWYQHFRHALKHPERRSCEVHLQRKDGKTFYASLVFLLATPSDSAAPLRIALTDITARRAAEGEFNQMSLVVAQSPVSIVITDRGGYIVYVNEAFSVASGYAVAEVFGKNPRILKSGRTDPQTYIELWAALTAGKSWHGEFINRRKDGTEYHEVATISPLRQADGKITHYLAVKTDITDLNQAMSTLQRTRLAKSAAGLGVYDVDVISDKHEWDGLVRDIWGVGPDDSIDSAIFLAGVHPDDRVAVATSFNSLLDQLGNGECNTEYRVVNRIDGTVRNLAVNARAIVEAGRVVRVVGALRDVSAEKQIEQKRQERRNSMSLLANQQVAAQTAAAIAHELNQPLVSISAYSEAALRMLLGGSKDPDKLMRSLEGAVEQAQRAGETLHELLDFLHKGVAMSAPVDLNEVVHTALASAVESGYGGFHPEVQLEPNLQPVLANRLQLEKVMLNLLNNGVDAMRGAGIPAAAITITVRTTKAGNMAQVTVQDCGPGVDSETAQRIFQPFFTTKSEGIGLGLSISRALVESHGGSLWLDPENKVGAAFHFTVPFAQ
jgi:PAS domain S-box-containing protein